MQGAADLLIAIAKLRSAVFSRATALVGSFMESRPWFPQVPGRSGFVLRFLSLLPMVVWFVLVIIRIVDTR